MSYLDTLLQGVEVEWKTLGEVCDTVTAPSKVKKESYRDTGKLPIIDQGIEFIAGYTDENFRAVEKNDYVIFGDHSEHIKYVDFSFIQGADGLKILKPKVDISKYIYYAFLNIYQKELSYKRHWTTAKETLIPIPPLPVQKEIVRILDKFTELTAELTAELIARKKQYSHYREQLLSFDVMENGEWKMENFPSRKVEWKTLGEVANYSKERISFEKLDKNNYVGVDNLLQNKEGKTNSNYVPQTGNSTKYNINDILIGNIRPYLKKIWHSNQVGGTNGDVLVIHPTDKNISPRYLFQILADDRFFEYNMQYAKGAKMPRGNKDKILEYRIPFPPLKEQDRIVSILDKFDILTTSISEGLPKEIELRKKQYEYYRDMLLTFPKNEI